MATATVQLTAVRTISERVEIHDNEMGNGTVPNGIQNGGFLHDGTDDTWKPDMESYSGVKRRLVQNSNSKTKDLYENQRSLIEEYECIRNDEVMSAEESREEERKKAKTAEICAKVSFAVNLFLFFIKILAGILSGSLAIIASVVDSAVDLVSGVVLWYTARAMKKKDYVKYPGGKRRMEPIAVLMLAVIMSMTSAVLILMGIQQIQGYIKDEDPEGPVVDGWSIGIICITVASKLTMWLVMRRIPRNSVQALAQDHRNDVFSNCIALTMGYIGSEVWVFADPLGAILISIYILTSWCFTAAEQVKFLTGRAADRQFQSKLIWVAMNHDPNIMQICSVQAFYFGNNYLVELHIRLPEDMTIKEAHGIGESLQVRIEKMEEVERAFVHIDCDSEHSFADEHKQL